MTTRIVFIPETQNLNCSHCSGAAVQVLLQMEGGNVMEVISAQCQEHAIGDERERRSEFRRVSDG